MLILPDGSTILLDGDTRLELTQVADPRQGSLDTLLKLYFGQVLSLASIDVGETFKIEAEVGAWAGVTGSVMGVIYDPEESQLLAVDCLEGHCVHSGVNDGDELELIGGKSRLPDRRRLSRGELPVGRGGLAGLVCSGKQRDRSACPAGDFCFPRALHHLHPGSNGCGHNSHSGTHLHTDTDSGVLFPDDQPRSTAALVFRQMPIVPGTNTARAPSSLSPHLQPKTSTS